jgi:hypothetical protein
MFMSLPATGCLIAPHGCISWPPLTIAGYLSLPAHNSSVSERTLSQSYVMTDGQLASLSWCQAPSGTQDQIVITVRHLQIC